MTLPPETRIYVAGHTGLAGSAVLRRLRALGYRDIVLRTHRELDLTRQADVRRFFDAERPQVVFLCAARVGGILANQREPADFVRENLEIQTNVIGSAFDTGVRRLLFLGSSCIYPRDCPQPMKEEHLLGGALEPTNRAYAVAKIAGIETIWSYNRQHGTGYLAVMPTNLYGPGDTYDAERSHVLPALVLRMHRAKQAGAEHVDAWGSGTPRRELLYSDDLGDACVFLMRLPEVDLARELDPDRAPILNVGCGEDFTVRELTEQVRAAVGFTGEVRWDRSKPDGVARKLLDSARIRALGWEPRTGLAEGLRLAYRDFLARYG